MSRRLAVGLIAVLGLIAVGVSNASADAIFSGNFTTANDVQWFETNNLSPPIVFETQSYVLGGFDPQLFLFDTSGNLLVADDDGGPSLDALISYTASGHYYLALTAFNNDPILSSGVFAGWSGSGVDFGSRTGYWQVHFGDSSDEGIISPPSFASVPEASSLLLLGSGLLGLVGYGRKRMKR